MMIRRVFAVFLLFSAAASVFAGPVSIFYQAENLGSGRWQYNYTLVNNSLSEGVNEFTIWFDYGLYEDMAIEPGNISDKFWDEIVSEPLCIPPFAPYNGIYDALVLQDGAVTAGQSVNGFTVSFNWLGDGTPMSQYFQIIDPDTFETIADGYTITEAISTVPLPGALILSIIGIGTVKLRKK